MEPNKPFRAFVSYSHADRDFAARLQRRLESYRLPRRLADRVTPLPGQAPGRIGPIFRDRADLSAAADLSQAVQDAIAQSSALVVVASPDAVQSRWVGREIALFRTLNPAAPILVAHARGEPEQALPEPLRGATEPLAADFRREGDGPRLAFLKIVAGLAGLPLDALVQRDAQRRLRRVTAVTLGALLMALLMTATTVFALVSRAQAVHERTQAEGLIEFMLTDLRTKLRGVGRLDVMESVNQRAMAYYADQGDLSHLSDDSLARRAQILHAMGEDDGDRDQLADALAKFREAHRTTGALLARNPTDPDRIYGHSQSEFWLGSAALDLNDRATARQRFGEYARLSRQLVTMDPRNKDWQMEGGYAESNLGTLAYRDDRPAEAQAAFERAGSYFLAARKLAPDDTGVIRDLADNHGWLADSLYAQRQFARAYDERVRERSLILKLAEGDRQNANYSRDLAESAIGLARIEIALGRRDAALERLRATRAVIDTLASRDPANKRTARLRAAITLALADQLAAGGTRTPDVPAIIADALRLCATPDALSGSADQKRLCHQLRTRQSRVSVH